jgi:hypothetical protein
MKVFVLGATGFIGAGSRSGLWPLVTTSAA